MTDERVWETIIGEEAEGRRLDAALADDEGLGLSRNRIQQLIGDGRVTVDGSVTRPSHRLAGGERVVVSIPAPEPSTVVGEDIYVPIVHEDEDIIVVDKPRGMVVHPAVGHRRGTLVNALVQHCPDLTGVGGVLRPGLVHRLDRDTTGLLVVAKNDRSLESLSRQIKERLVIKEYLAIAVGSISPTRGVIEAPIGRHPRHRQKMAVVTGGRDAVTHYQIVEQAGSYSLVRLRLETGRTHQIRVHLTHVGMPIVGDPVYGSRPEQGVFDGGQALHATRLSFRHPGTGEWLEFDSPLPADLGQLWLQLGGTLTDRDR